MKAGAADLYQIPLWTMRGRPWSPEAEKRDLRLNVLESLVRQFHWFNEGRPLELEAQCPECPGHLRALVIVGGAAAAYCPACGWVMNVKIEWE